MIRIAWAVAVAAGAYMTVSEVATAAPMAPLPAAVTTDVGSTIPVYYYRGGYYRYRWNGGYYHHRAWRHNRWYYY